MEYVTSRICTLRLGLSLSGGLAYGGVPRMHTMSRRSLARHLHFSSNMCFGGAMMI